MLAQVQAAVDQRPAGTTLILLFDFDGTLAEFNPDPAAPVLAPHRRGWMETLWQRPDTAVGIVSGRRLDDLRRRTALSSTVYLAGLHGLEIEVESRRWAHPDLDRAGGMVRGLAARLAEVVAAFPAAAVEDKHASVAIHARRVLADARAQVFAHADRVAAPWITARLVRRLDGDAVVEYLPNISGHKGEALAWIVRDVELRTGRPAWVVYVGDDVTDEDAFRAIKPGSGIAVLVGLRPTAATHKVDGIVEVDKLLSWLASRE